MQFVWSCRALGPHGANNFNGGFNPEEYDHRYRNHPKYNYSFAHITSPLPSEKAVTPVTHPPQRQVIICKRLVGEWAET